MCGVESLLKGFRAAIAVLTFRLELLFLVVSGEENGLSEGDEMIEMVVKLALKVKKCMVNLQVHSACLLTLLDYI